MTVRILIADDHEVVRMGLRRRGEVLQWASWSTGGHPHEVTR